MVEEMATPSELLSNQPVGDKPTDAPQEQHRPVMSVDRTENAEAHRHILLPVDDTEACWYPIICTYERQTFGKTWGMRISNNGSGL